MARKKPNSKNVKITDEEVEEFIGKHLLAGITYFDLVGNVDSCVQIHGIIVRINEDEGIVVRVNNEGKEFKLPPYLPHLVRAQPGEYRLRATGEVVVNPDFAMVWNVYPKGYQGSV